MNPHALFSGPAPCSCSFCLKPLQRLGHHGRFDAGDDAGIERAFGELRHRGMQSRAARRMADAQNAASRAKRSHNDSLDAVRKPALEIVGQTRPRGWQAERQGDA